MGGVLNRRGRRRNRKRTICNEKQKKKGEEVFKDRRWKV